MSASCCILLAIGVTGGSLSAEVAAVIIGG
jgi:hypothetical protein